MNTVEQNFVRLGYPLEQNHVTMTQGKVEDTLVVDGPVCVDEHRRRLVRPGPCVAWTV